MAQASVIWDPLRKKDVALTPEERVRQWCISVLAEEMEIPMHMMMSEASIKLGDKQLRVDIVVYDRHIRPLVVVECKRPEIELNSDVLDQVLRYNMVLNVGYLIITNGHRTVIYKKNDRGYGQIDYVPKYNEMVCLQ